MGYRVIEVPKLLADERKDALKEVNFSIET